MHHDFLDKYSDRDSPVHRLHPLIKLICYLVLIVAILWTGVNNPQRSLIIGIIIWGIIIESKLPPGYIISKTLILLPLFIFLVLLQPFFKGETVVLRIHILFPLALTREGMNMALSIGIKALLILWATLTLLSTNRFSELLHALGMLRCPAVMIMVLSFIYRYIFLLVNEMERLNTARQARLFQRQSLVWFFRTIICLVTSTLMRSFDRSERIYQAMCARGFHGQIHLLDARPLTALDIAISALFVGSVVGLMFFV